MSIFHKLSSASLLFLVALQAFAQQAGELVEVAENVYAFGTAATSLVVVTDEGVVVVDPVNSRQSKALVKALPEITQNPVTHVIYSHNHWDHISGGAIFAEQGALILSHSDAKENIKSNSEVKAPDLTWTGQQFDLTVGGTMIELHHFGPSHGKGMTVVLLPAQGIVFIVDIATAGRVFPMHMPDFDIDGLVVSIDAIETLDFEVAVFGHGKASFGSKLIGDKSDISEIGKYLDDLIAGVEEAMKTGGFMAVTQLELPQWKHLNMYDQWFKLNATRIVIAKTMGH